MSDTTPITVTETVPVVPPPRPDLFTVTYWNPESSLSDGGCWIPYGTSDGEYAQGLAKRQLHATIYRIPGDGAERVAGSESDVVAKLRLALRIETERGDIYERQYHAERKEADAMRQAVADAEQREQRIVELEEAVKVLAKIAERHEYLEEVRSTSPQVAGEVRREVSTAWAAASANPIASAAIKAEQP